MVSERSSPLSVYICYLAGNPTGISNRAWYADYLTNNILNNDNDPEGMGPGIGHF